MTNKELAKRLLVVILSGLAVVFVFSAVFAGGMGFYLYSQLKIFSEHSGLTFTEMRALAQEAWQTPVIASNDYKNILILGIDSHENRGGAPPLTDTIMLASVHLPSGRINTLSLPRDLWSDTYLTKINALYYYGQERYPTEPERFPAETIAEMLDVPVHHTVVISMDSLAELVDLIGGIKIDVPQGFTDEQFPRSDVDVTVERDPAKLYKTVTFVEGPETMSGERALEYIRSRHSDDDQGHDLARSERQQLVINSLIQKIMSPDIILDLALLGKLYQHYLNQYDQYLPIVELAALVKQLAPVRQDIALNPHSLTIYPDDESGALWHPPVRAYQNQWVYAVRDQTALEKQVQSIFTNESAIISQTE